MNKAEILEKYGITPDKALEVESLVTLFNNYTALVQQARDSVSTGDDTLKSITDEFSKDEGLQLLKPRFTEAIMGVIYEFLMETNPEDEDSWKYSGDMSFSIFAYEILNEAQKIVKYERDVHIAKLRRKSNSAQEEVSNEDFESLKEEAELVGETLREMFQFMLSFKSELLLDAPLKPKTIEGLPMEVTKPKEYKKSGTTSKSSVVLALPKLPWVRKTDEVSTVGRKVTGSHLNLLWNGELVFPSTKCATPNDVAHHYVSDRQNGYHMTWKAILDVLKDNGKNIMKDEWSLEFPTGTLEGSIRKDEEN